MAQEKERIEDVQTDLEIALNDIKVRIIDFIFTEKERSYCVKKLRPRKLKIRDH